MKSKSGTLVIAREPSALAWMLPFLKHAPVDFDVATYDLQKGEHHTFSPDATLGEIAAYVRSKCYARVILLSNQSGLLDDAHLAEVLRKDGILVVAQSMQAASLGSDKLAQKEFFAHNDIPTPPFSAAPNKTAALQAAHELGYPVLCKAPNLSDGRRMGVLDSDGALETYFYEEVPAERSYIEKFIEGTEVSTLVYYNFGSPVVFPVVYKPTTDYLLKGQSVRGRTYAIAPTQQGTLERRIQDMALKLSQRINNEFLLGLDIVIDKKGEPYVLECNARVVETLRMSIIASEFNVLKLMLEGIVVTKKSPYVDAVHAVIDMAAPHTSPKSMPELASVSPSRITLRGNNLEQLIALEHQMAKPIARKRPRAASH
jgi:carbamoylphosphate synthase large subunit